MKILFQYSLSDTYHIAAFLRFFDDMHVEGRDRPQEGPFAALIRCGAVADKANEKQVAALMRYASVYKPDSEPLDQFIKRKGGINACAARSSRRLGRDAAKRSKRRLTRGNK